MKTTAIILAGGKGKRMGSDIPKQYLEIGNKPVLYYSVKAFEESCVDEIIIVAAGTDIPMVKEDIVERYGFSKVKNVVAGGIERYDSVYQGLLAADGADYVLIHDGARPCVTADIIERSIRAAKKYKACAAGMPVKDTIKTVDKNGFALNTPDRRMLWAIQTPQTFSYELIMEAHNARIKARDKDVTDDAMLVERYTKTPVYIFEGSYDNIKITTGEDMEIAALKLISR